MEIIQNVQDTTSEFPHVVLTVGSFDGVHLGHQRVLQELVRVARERNGTAAVLTMRPHPREFFSPDHAPNLLTCDKKKLQLFEEACVDVVFFLPFSAEVARLDHDEFIKHIVQDRCHAKTMIVGHDFCFGRDARGDYAYLKRVGPKRGFEVRQAPPLVIDGERVSSTLIRERVLQGDLEEAEVFLGRKYSLVGRVIPGRGIGAGLGFPTANVEPHHSAVPAQGVYIAEALVRGRRHAAAVNIGVAPTIRQEDIVVEAFILDFHESILGETFEIVFHKRLRSEKKFNTRDDLVRQILEDVEAVRDHFSRHA